MTIKKSTLRPRRSTGAQGIPGDLAAWFDGKETTAPWSALLPPDYELLPGRWRAWKAAHPAAHPPAGYEYLDEISTTAKETS